MKKTIKSLPRLCYIGEVPVESSYHGSALLWRLLENYPCKSLLIIEGIHRSSVKRRLPNVRYLHPILPGMSRMLRTRFAKQISSALYRSAPILAASLVPRLSYDGPEAIITVCHGVYWRVAAKVASILKLPLHLIVHDHVPTTLGVSERLRSQVFHDFGTAYATSASRFCVSEEMAVEYERAFGITGSVLYPSRACESANEVLVVPSRRRNAAQRLIGVFAGTINHRGYVNAIVETARQLDRLGGTLVLYGPLGRAEAPPELNLPNVEFRGLVSATVLRDQCRQEADFLYVPMSFDPADRENMRLSFPSKIADYTAMGLPLLVHGPEYCSAVRWALKNSGVGEVVSSEASDELFQALSRLSDPIRCQALGSEALRVGELYFSHARAESMLFDALSNASRVS